MNKKIICISTILMLLLTVFSSINAISLDVKNENQASDSSDSEITEIELTESEYNQIYSWCESIENDVIKSLVKQALDQTIDEDLVLRINALNDKLNKILTDPYLEEDATERGILPAVALVRCKWDIESDSKGKRYVHFWIIGYGSHSIEWDTKDDFDGDGTWDLGPGSHWHYDWFAFLVPLRHYDEYAGWKGYSGRAKVQVWYKVDDNDASTKTFEEPTDSGDRVQAAPSLLNIIKNLKNLPIFERLILVKSFLSKLTV